MHEERHRDSGQIRNDDRGYVVAESAFVIPAMIAVAAVAVSLMVVAIAILNLQNAAHTAARDIARGAPPHEVHATVSSAHPHTTVTVTPDPHGVTVTVHREVQILGGYLGGLSIPLTRRAMVPWEYGIQSSPHMRLPS